ncbi:MAG: ribonuclease HII [Candidatus Altiarchaeales archaeon]|nr:ribonuclease HII [Candidatus Altiarchaeales archaeon]
MLYEHDRKIIRETGARYVVGVDEAGRGPLAGPLVISSVVLDLEDPIEGIRDSKKLSERKREALAHTIEAKALVSLVSIVNEDLIDRINILQATLYGMFNCVKHWSHRDDMLVLVDGNKSIPNFPEERQKTIIKGDSLSASIAVASILAKTKRDSLMRKSSNLYPLYEFETHKGYPTKKHIELIRRWGLSEIHRKSFCKKFVE